MTAYNDIADSMIDAESPITVDLMTYMRDNPIAIVEGAAGAPRISRRAISPGGAEIDADISNGITMPTDPGFYEWDYLTLTIAKTVPCATIARIDGNCVLSSTLSVDTVDDAARSKLERWFQAISGENGVDVGAGTGGGGNIGAGGHGNSTAGGAGFSISGLQRAWLTRIPILGGRGGKVGSGAYAEGGGSIILMINGDLDMSGGGIIDAGGQAGVDGGTYATGSGAGGSIIIICNGTITGGTFKANGKTGGDSNSERGGGSGGGYVALVAAGYAGSQTIDVSGGPIGGGGGGGSIGGNAGSSEQITLTEAQINALLLR